MGKTFRVVLAGLLLFALSAGMAVAQISAEDTIQCSKGGPERCNGSSGNDRITGSSRADDIRARGGKDLVLGESGNDNTNSGAGLEGGSGNDTVKGQGGEDTVKDGTRGDIDRLFGGPANDFVDGQDGDGRDTLNCGTGRDVYVKDRGDTVKSNCERRL